MKRLVQLPMALAVVSLASMAFAAGDGGEANSPLNTPTEQEKKDSKALLDLLEADEQKPPTDPPDATARTGIFGRTPFLDPARPFEWPDERVVPTYPGGTKIPALGSTIDGDLEPQWGGRTRLTFDTSFTGSDKLRLQFKYEQPVSSDIPSRRLFGAPPEDDFVVGLPVAPGVEGSGPDLKITAIVRDEVAVGLQVGIRTESGIGQGLGFGTGHQNIPSEPILFTFVDDPSAEATYSFDSFPSAYGTTVVQTNTAGGPPFPDLFFPPDPNAGVPLWPCCAQESGHQFWKFTPATVVPITVEIIEIDDGTLDLVRLGTQVKFRGGN